MAALISNIGGVVMLVGVILMALPVIRVAPWGYTPLFEAGLAIFLFGLVVTLLGAIGWLIGIAFAGTLLNYPLSGA
ncbi:MAG: hypothetical protein J0H88_16280 [Sphingomonadales bacterium]|nr:hypothetical protein [Sphingomonadales bacterium]